MDQIPSRRVLLEAERENIELKHENNGFLSKEFGFVPKNPPLLSLPAAFLEWDTFAAEMKDHHRRVRVRKVLDQMPLLDASVENLPDQYLLRAQLLLGIFAHGYYWCELGKPERLPESILQPWELVCKRLGRKEVTLTISDLFLYNWRFKNPHDNTRSIENFDLLVNVFDRPEEAQFYLTVLDSAAKSAQIVEWVIEAQEATQIEDNQKIKQCLAAISDDFRAVTESLSSISLFKYAPNFCNPIIWARTAGVFTHPVRPNSMGPGAGGTPYIHLIDIFLHREHYDSRIGKEQLKFIDRADTKHTKRFLSAVAEISIKKYIASKGDNEMMGLYSGLIESFSGDKGFLGAHRRKAYGFLEGSIKAGRIETTGHFAAEVKNIFHDKAWIELNKQFTLAEKERSTEIRYQYPTVTCVNVAGDKKNKIVTLDISTTGLDYRPGDYIRILPQNSRELVEKTIEAFHATGEEEIEINTAWHLHLLRLAKVTEQQKTLTLREFLSFAHLRPVEKSAISHFYALTHDGDVRDVLTKGLTNEIELWELLSLVRPNHYRIGRMLEAPSHHRENISNVISPLLFRTYSVAAVHKDAKSLVPTQVELLVQPLEHKACPFGQHSDETRHGVASNFLTSNEILGEKIAAKTLYSIDFKLPNDVSAPIVMFAGGSGIAPFRAFLKNAINSKRNSEFYLFISVESRQALWFKEEIEYWLNALPLTLFINCSREDTTFVVAQDKTKKVLVDAHRPKSRIQSVMLEPDVSDLLRKLFDRGYFFVCGQVGFGQSVYDTLVQLAQTHGDTSDELIYKLVAAGRLVMSIFTSYRSKAEIDSEITVSELVLHNDRSNGYWMAINGFVYDVSDFTNTHPGGHYTLINSSGVDATLEYESIGHHLDAGVDAKLDLYLKAKLKPLKLKRRVECAVIGNKFTTLSLDEFYQIWVKELYTAVEMQNAARNMYEIFDSICVDWKLNDEESSIAFRTQAAAQDHRTFLQLYLAPLISSLNRLWSVTASMCTADVEIGLLQTRMDALLHSDHHQQILKIPQMLSQWSKAEEVLKGNACKERIHILENLKVSNLALLAEVKETLRKGIQVFEKHGDSVLSDGGKDLLNLLSRTPALISQYQKAIHV